MFFLPSRGRPQNLKRFFEHYELTNSTAPGVVWLDDDDVEYYAAICGKIPSNWKVISAPRADGLGEITNKFFNMYPDEPWYGLLGDDVIPRTDQWDRKLIEAAGKGLSYCNDGLNGRSHATHMVISGDMVRELGWLALPGCKRTYIDDALFVFAKRKGLTTYLPDVLLEHMHFSNGKSAMDETYKKPVSQDRQIFDEWLKTLDKPVKIVCVNQGNYLGKGVEYVNILYNSVLRNIRSGYPGSFVCLCDDIGADYHPDIQLLPLPKEISGWWSKLYLFKEGLFKENERIIYLDLDTVITGSLDSIVKYDGEFAILRDFYHDRYAPGMMMWRAGFGHDIWDSYEKNGFPTDLPLGDLSWINNHFAQTGYKPQIIQDIFPNEVVSYKVDATLAIPKHAKIVCFHGLPRPHEAEGWVPYIWKIDGGSVLDMQTIGNTSEQVLIKNIHDCIANNYPAIETVDAHGMEAIIVGGGPSLKDTLWQIKLRQDNGAMVFSTNNTWRVLREYGIEPDFHVMLDARLENIEFVPDSIPCFYASQVHPDVLKKAFNLTIWHSYAGGIETVIEDDKRDTPLISGGSTVGLKAMCIAYVLGFRTMHLHGFDSSYRQGEHHAYSQKLNDGEHVVDLVCNGKNYKAAAWMAQQVEEFKELSSLLVGMGCSISVYGDGLLPDVAKLMAA